MYCTSCGMELPKKAKFCPKCGEITNHISIKNTTSIKPKNIKLFIKVLLLMICVIAVCLIASKAGGKSPEDVIAEYFGELDGYNSNKIVKLIFPEARKYYKKLGYDNTGILSFVEYHTDGNGNLKIKNWEVTNTDTDDVNFINHQELIKSIYGVIIDGHEEIVVAATDTDGCVWQFTFSMLLYKDRWYISSVTSVMLGQGYFSVEDLITSYFLAVKNYDIDSVMDMLPPNFWSYIMYEDGFSEYSDFLSDYDGIFYDGGYGSNINYDISCISYIDKNDYYFSDIVARFGIDYAYEVEVETFYFVDEFYYFDIVSIDNLFYLISVC